MNTNIKNRIEKILRGLNINIDQPSWTKIINKNIVEWEKAKQKTNSDHKILIATSSGGHKASTTLESLLAVALTFKGIEVHILLCDEILPACLLSTYDRFPDFNDFVKDGPQKKVCWDCYSIGSQVFKPLGLNIHRYSDFVNDKDQNEITNIIETIKFQDIQNYTRNNLKIGEHAMAGALRFYAKGTLEGEPTSEGILRRYFEASLLTASITGKLFNEHKFKSAVFNHGIYVPQGLIGEVARKHNVDVINWNPAYRKKCFIFSHGDTYHHTLLSEPNSNWDSIEWSKQHETEIKLYLKSRMQGNRDWIHFNRKPVENIEAISNELKIDFSKPTIGMLTNVMWDAQLHYPANAFNNMLEWVIKTVHYFIERPDLQLLIRVHPAEISGFHPSRQPIIEEIQNEFSTLPSNIYIIPPESHISTYIVMEKCNSVIIYGTKMGVELTSLGIPVIVAGEAWIRNKGVTYDIGSINEYYNLLKNLPFNKQLDKKTITRAQKYAFHYFFRRMIPIQCIDPSIIKNPYRINLSNIKNIYPGFDEGLDIICDGIINGFDFIYPYEKYINKN